MERATRNRRTGAAESPRAGPLRALAVSLGILVPASLAVAPGALLAASPSPHPSPVLTPAASTAPPLADPSASAVPSPSTGASPAPGPGILGADAEMYREGFDEAPGWLDLGADEEGRTSLEAGSLFMSIKGRRLNYIDSYELAAPVPVLRVEALVAIDGRDATGAGVACGTDRTPPSWFIAGVNNADEWYLGQQVEGRFDLLDRGYLMLPTSPSRDPVTVAIECAVAIADGGDYVAISVDGRPVSVETGLGRLEDALGPYGRAGLYVTTDRGTGSALFDDLVVHAGDAFERTPAERDPTLPSE